jgi:homogentisate 1,2-dioxygenase
MPYYQRQGQIPPKRHTQFRNADGKLRFEELFSTQGFGGPYSLLYHETYPVEILRAESGGTMDPDEWMIDAQQNRCMITSKIDSSGDVLSSRRPMIFNEDVTVSIANPDRACDGFYRNALCDEMIMIMEGSGAVQSPFGVIVYESGDVIVIPRGTTYDLRPGNVDNRFVILESRTSIVPPKKYFVDGGQMAEHSPFCERDFRTPVLPPPVIKRDEFQVTTKHGSRITVYKVPNHPFDVVGWDGSLYPFAMNIRDFEPVTRRIHTMPDEQQAFETAGAAICLVVPRAADYHPIAIPSPPIHSSIDCDEILVNLSGSLMGWKEGAKGMMTLHPRGLLHAAKVYEESVGIKAFEGLALLIDTFKPLKLTKFAEKCADPHYQDVWSRA